MLIMTQESSKYQCGMCNTFSYVQLQCHLASMSCILYSLVNDASCTNEAFFVNKDITYIEKKYQ